MSKVQYQGNGRCEPVRAVEQSEQSGSNQRNGDERMIMAETIIVCQKCGQKIGHTVKIDGESWPVVGGVMVDYIKGVCVECGEVFFWSVVEQQLSRLIKHSLEQRKKYRA